MCISQLSPRLLQLRSRSEGIVFCALQRLLGGIGLLAQGFQCFESLQRKLSDMVQPALQILGMRLGFNRPGRPCLIGDMDALERAAQRLDQAAVAISHVFKNPDERLHVGPWVATA